MADIAEMVYKAWLRHGRIFEGYKPGEATDDEVVDLARKREYIRFSGPIRARSLEEWMTQPGSWLPIPKDSHKYGNFGAPVEGQGPDWTPANNTNCFVDIEGVLHSNVAKDVASRLSMAGTFVH